MSGIAPCVPGCSPTVQIVNTPGGSGQSAVTVTTASFVIPAAGATATITVGDTTWMKEGKNVFISDGSNKCNFLIAGINSAVSIDVGNLAFPDDSAPGGTISSGAIVAPGLGDYGVPTALDLLSAFTDNSGGTKSDTISANLVKSTITLGPFSMALLVNSQIWEVVVPFAFQVNSVLFRDDIAITTGAKAATFTSRINAVNMTGGVVSVAGTYATGATQAGTSISGNNTGTAGQTLEAIISGVTAFTEGYGHLEFNVTNLDLAATIAAIAFKMNQLRTALRHQ